MDHYEALREQTLPVKSAQTLQKHIKFEALPTFLKFGLYYFYTFQNVRKQQFHPQYAACELMKSKGNRHYNQHRFGEAINEYEHVK